MTWPRKVRSGRSDRWIITDRRWLGIYVHHLYPDLPDEAPHDHSASFVSIVLRGGYAETVVDMLGPRTVVHRAPSVHRMHWTSRHRVERVLAGTWTLWITGPARRPRR